jgi:DNA-binding NtrC family response regulator
MGCECLSEGQGARGSEVTRRVPSYCTSAITQYPSKAMRATLLEGSCAALCDASVLLTGESGSGKDWLARWIHSHSERANGLFFTLNCAAVPSELAESELFGHEAGAFTGAHAQKKGLLELAEGGTLMLNEIGELSSALQPKLLTFLDTKRFLRLGGKKSISIDARIIAASHRDLMQEVANGTFLEPLFFRLNVLGIRVPPLRERRRDIPILAKEMLSKIATELKMTGVPVLDAGSIRVLLSYHWPGNVRELQNFLERSLILSGEGPLHLSPPFPGQDILKDRCWNWNTTWPPTMPFDELIRDLKRALIEEALRHSRGKRQPAAEMLGLTRYALKRQMKSLGFIGPSRPDR